MKRPAAYTDPTHLPKWKIEFCLKLQFQYVARKIRVRANREGLASARHLGKDLKDTRNQMSEPWLSFSSREITHAKVLRKNLVRC